MENFSTDKRESFFEKEIPFLSKNFTKVIVIPLYPDSSSLKLQLPNVEVKDFDFFSPSNRLKTLLMNPLVILRCFIFELIKTHNKWFYFRNAPKLINQLLLRIATADKLEEQIEKDISNSIFYTYWFNQWTFAMALIKQKHPQIKIITRVHGCDYDESQVKTILPFRYYQLSKINKVYAVSQFAKNYLVNKFKVPAQKIEVARLGLPYEHSLSPIDTSQLTLVSCSSIIPLKRIHLVIEILKNINIPVQWVHFGDGPLMPTIKKLSESLAQNVNVVLKGHIPNNAFLNYLKSSPVSFFINVSESEGIPVSMMEAISFGIPLIGTNICGVPEIITAQTGFLIPADFNASQVSEMIVNEHISKKIYSNEFRTGIREFYKARFYAPVNYSELANKFKSTGATETLPEQKKDNLCVA